MSPWIEAAAAVLHSVVQNYLSSTGLFNRHCWTVMSSWQFNCLWIETSAAPVALSDWRKVNDDQVSNSFRISIQHYCGGGKRQTFLSPFPFASEKSGFAFCFLSSQKAEQKGGGSTFPSIPTWAVTFFARFLKEWQLLPSTWVVSFACAYLYWSGSQWAETFNTRDLGSLSAHFLGRFPFHPSSFLLITASSGMPLQRCAMLCSCVLVWVFQSIACRLAH